MIIDKIYNLDERQIEFADISTIKRYLAPVMKYVMFFKRGFKYATVEVWFSSGGKTREFSDKTLRTEVVILPTFMEHSRSRVRIEKVPPQVEAASVMAVLCC